jgi:hypothetical protein
MMNENEIVNETSPDEVWESVDGETRESVINMFLHLAFKLVISQAAQVWTNDDGASNEIGDAMDDG